MMIMNNIHLIFESEDGLCHLLLHYILDKLK